MAHTKNTVKSPTYGIFDTPITLHEPLSHVDFTFLPIDFIAHWDRCSITANYLGDFLTFNFEKSPQTCSLLSTIINELIENSIKFSADANKELQLTVENYGDYLAIQTMNLAYKKQADAFNEFLNQLFSKDPEELFLEKITHNAENNFTESELGLLTLKKDYDAELGFKLIPDADNSLYEVYVKVILKTEEVYHENR